MKPRILVLSGVRAGEVFPLTAEAFSIGRDEAARFFIDDPWLSRRHCAVTFEDGEYQLEDLGSNNGTTVNGESITGKRILRGGDRIGVGETELLFRTEEDAAEEFDPKQAPVFLDDSPVEDSETVDIGDSALQLNALIDVANAFRDTRDASAIREKLISLIFATIPADRVAILMRDSDGTEFEIRSGRNRRDPARSIQASRSIANRVYKANAPILSNDLFASGFQSIKSLKDANVRALVCVPLSTFDRKYGVLYADTSDPFARFDQDHLDWLMAVATMAALAFGTTSYIEDVILELEGPHNLLGESAPMTELRKRVGAVAPAKSTVLILGETGTGKELVARAIHLNSKRAKALFVPVNCATLAGDLLENELFGHEQGAYTGALKRYIGKIERASGGTLFLDEVGELPLATQAKLLRVLQEREIERVGGSGPSAVDIRLIAATNRDLETLVTEGRFREDLFYRLNVVCIRTPTLRERREDILPLARHFALKFAKENARPAPGISPEAEALLLNYAWPGNVRELGNVMENAIVCGETNVVRPEDLRLGASVGAKTSKPNVWNYHEFTKESKIEFLTNALTLAHGDRKQAAASIGLHPHSLDRLMKQLGMTGLE